MCQVCAKLTLNNVYLEHKCSIKLSPKISKTRLTNAFPIHYINWELNVLNILFTSLLFFSFKRNGTETLSVSSFIYSKAYLLLLLAPVCPTHGPWAHLPPHPPRSQIPG